MESNSRKTFAFPVITAVIAAGLFGAAFDSRADLLSNHPSDRCLSIDLRTGTHTAVPDPFIEFVVPPQDSNQDGWFETVLKIRINDPALPSSAKAALFVVKYDGVPAGLTVNIGDSRSNNGGGGDGADQSNDAELQIGGLLGEDSSLFDDLFVFGHDGIVPARGMQRMALVDNIVKQNETIALVVANDSLRYLNLDFPISGRIDSEWLYALNGQPDTEGPVNYDIFASFNRVIGTSSRIGRGAGEVTVCLGPPLLLFNEDRENNDGHF